MVEGHAQRTEEVGAVRTASLGKNRASLQVNNSCKARLATQVQMCHRDAEIFTESKEDKNEFGDYKG